MSFSLSEPGRSVGGFSGFVVYCYHLSISLVPSNLVYFIGIKLFSLFIAFFFFVAFKIIWCPFNFILYDQKFFVL